MTHLACADAPTNDETARADAPLRRGDRVPRSPRRRAEVRTPPTARPSSAATRGSTRCDPGSRSSASRPRAARQRAAHARAPPRHARAHRGRRRARHRGGGARGVRRDLGRATRSRSPRLPSGTRTASRASLRTAGTCSFAASARPSSAPSRWTCRWSTSPTSRASPCATRWSCRRPGGPARAGRHPPDEVAGHTGTIAWEVLTSISRRVPRFYREP